jgi:hypothetical protein
MMLIGEKAQHFPANMVSQGLVKHEAQIFKTGACKATPPKHTEFYSIFGPPRRLTAKAATGNQGPQQDKAGGAIGYNPFSAKGNNMIVKQGLSAGTVRTS